MATRTISTKLAIEGEAQYKQALSACNAELKTLKSSLALAESEYKNNANSMEALTAKGKALSDMQAEQAKKVSLLETALKNAQSHQQAYADAAADAGKKVAQYAAELEKLKSSTGDTQQEQAQLTAEIEKWTKVQQEAEAASAAAVKGVQSWQQQLNSAKIEQNSLSEAAQKNSQYLEEAAASADGCAKSIDEYGKEVKEAGDSSADFGEKSKKAIDQLAAALAAAGIAKTAEEIAELLMECSKSAGAFETAMAKVSTLADQNAVPLENLKSQLLSLSSETGIAVGGLAEATYQALSAGVDTANVVDFVATATKTAKAGFTEASTAVDVLTTAINAYKMEGTEAERVASMLVKTQDEGKTSVGELAANLGQIIPTAAAYNVSLENLTTSYALLTKNGTNTAISTTNLSSMLDELGKNGSTVADVLEAKTGKSFAELMSSGSNLGNIMTILSDSVDGNLTAFSNLWGSSTAGKAALSLLKTGAEEFDRTLGVMASSSGTVDRNFKTMTDNLEFAEQRFSNAAQNAMIAIGDQLNPALEKLYSTGANAFEWAEEFVKEHPDTVKAIAAVVVGLMTLAGGVASVTAAAAAFSAIMAANPIGLLAAAAVAAVAAIGTFAAMVTSASEETRSFTSSLQETKTAYDDLTATMAEGHETTAATAASLQELLAVEEKSALQKDLIAQKVAELNAAVPELGISYDKERDSLEGLTAAELEAALARAAAKEEYEAQVSRLNELDTERAAIEARLTEARLALNEAEEAGTGNVRELQNNIAELTAAQEENAAQITELENASREYGEKQAEAAQKTQEMTSRVESLVSEMEELQAAYEKTYDEAMESIEKQLGLFKELDGSAKTSINNLIDTLKGQVAYMETYAKNIQRAMELGVDEGLIRKLSDGSEESAQILAAIVEGGQEEIEALNEQLAKVEEGKENFSSTIAEMEHDFNEQMEAVVRDLGDAIQDMDLSDETYTIGENNIQGLINGTASMKRDLVAEYAEMGRSAIDAYKREVDQHSPSKKFVQMGSYDIQGIIEGVEREKANLAAAYEDSAQAALRSMERAMPSTFRVPRVTTWEEQAGALAETASSRGEGASPVQIYVDRMEVRSDEDIQRVAQELYYLTAREFRSRGGGVL